MTELMKRYEEKYGTSPWEEVLTEDFNLFIYDITILNVDITAKIINDCIILE